MGCDIHPHIEVKINDKWEHYSCPNIQRCYRLFAKICGVRNCEEWGIVPLVSIQDAIPKDSSTVTKECWEYDSGHSIAVLNKQQFCKLIEWADDPENVKQKWAGEWSHLQLGYLTGNGFELYPGSTSESITDVRFICWFDN